ncbi:hypothetical protein B0H10DRAFT_2233459 [Mycena sp. CBHHK59/15]|nr:hypothetical protein B0H10DRAFT_2233459 [Mycena sp. CBHHK59/15]
MPEGRETTVSGKSVQKGFETAKANGETFKLESIVVDATDSEAAPAGAPASVKEGLPRVLTPSSSVQRGQRSHQTSVYPPTFKPTSEKPNPPLLETLVLEKITYTHRALILHFNSILLMVQVSRFWNGKKKWGSTARQKLWIVNVRSVEANSGKCNWLMSS